MKPLGRKSAGTRRCTECRHYVAIGTRGYCSRAVPPTINVRLLSQEGIMRQCVACPPEMTCADWIAK